MTTPTPAVWSDGDPLMAAIAAAVSAQCQTHPEQGLTVDDPRTIAAVAATVARQVLGTPTTDPVICVHPEGYEGECPCPPSCTCCNVSAAALQPASAPAVPTDRATVLREAYEIAHAEGMRLNALESEIGVGPYRGALGVAHLLRRLADEAQPEPVDIEESHKDAARRFARRLAAVERLCSGRPGYHTITVKALLTAMSDADDEPATAATEEPQPKRPVVAYNDGKGSERVYCVLCPRPDDVTNPLDANAVDDWDMCPSCGRHCIDVARAATEEPQP